MALDHSANVTRLAPLLDIIPTSTAFANVDKDLATAAFNWFFSIQSDGLPESTVPFQVKLKRDMRLSLSAGAWWDFFGSNSLHVSASPLANRLQCALERAAIFRQRVFHFWRNGGVNASRNDAIAFQLAELLDEHLFGNSRNQPAQLCKAICLLM